MVQNNNLLFKFKQCICSHKFKQIATHSISNQTLSQCVECNIYLIKHEGVNLIYKCHQPNIEGWEHINQK